MCCFIPAWRVAAACCFCFCIAAVCSAQVANQQAIPVQDLLQLNREIEQLNFRIRGRLSEMNSVAGLSPHGYRDPNVKLMAEEVTRLNQQLVQRTAQLEKLYSEIRSTEVETALKANAVADVQSPPRNDGRSQQPSAAPYRKIELEGQQYYLVPVAEIDGLQDRPPRQRTKVITPRRPK